MTTLFRLRGYGKEAEHMLHHKQPPPHTFRSQVSHPNPKSDNTVIHLCLPHKPTIFPGDLSFVLLSLDPRSRRPLLLLRPFSAAASERPLRSALTSAPVVPGEAAEATPCTSRLGAGVHRYTHL